MKQKTTIAAGLCLALAVSSQGVNFVPVPGQSYWSNLAQWTDNTSGTYQPSTGFPTASDTVLLNAGRILSVDTHALAGTIALPNAPSDATLELAVAGKTLTVGTLLVGNDTQAGNGTVNQSAGTVAATTVKLRPTGTRRAAYNLSGGTLSATTLEVGISSASATGTSMCVQSDGVVTAANVTVGGAGTGSYQLSGGSLDAAGALNLNANGRFIIVGSEATASVGSLATQSGGVLDFVLDGTGVSTVQVDGGMSLANASIRVDGSAYSGTATNFVLLDAGTLVSMAGAGNISVTGLVNAGVMQLGDSVVLSVVESQAPVYFENTVGDGLWGTSGNWSSGLVPSGTVNAVVSTGLTATVSSPAPALNAVTIDGNATLIVQSDFSATAFHVGGAGAQGGGLLSLAGSHASEVSGADLTVYSQGSLEFVLDRVGITPLTLSGSVSLDPACQLIVDGTSYEGFDGYFPLLLAPAVPGSATNMSFTGFGAREPALVLQADGLWLRLIAPPSLSQRLCSLIPDSTVAGDYSNSLFSATRAYDPSGSAWSLTLSEGHVMDTRLSQVVDGSAVRSWDLRIARGGNIYSLRTGALGETVPPSYRSDGDTSPWNDEVWQAVAVDSSQNRPPTNSYFTHQSGVYLKDPILTEPFYSPQMAAWLDEASRSFTTINWAPQTHINIYADEDPANDFRSYVLMFTRYRDLGQGVIEVTQGDYNYGPDTLDFLNMPWGGVRRTTTEYAFLSNPGGTSWSDPVTNSFGPVTQKYNLTGGWMGFSATSSGVTPSLGFVFGKDHATPLPDQRYNYSTFRWGYAGTYDSYQSTETDWRNYFVTSCIRWYNLTEGNGFWSRYYFVLGDDMQDVSDRIAARQLVAAQLRAFDYTETSSPLVAYRFTGSGTGFRIQEDGRSPQFFLYAHPVSGSYPIFEILESDESRYLTWNPYANGIVKPYDGTIAGMRLLGFAMPSTGTNGTYASLSSLLPAQNYLADGKTLVARTATPIETWRVAYFGFTNDAGDGANAANPDSDSANNLYEYGFGGDPTNGAWIGYLPTSGIYNDGGVTNWFEYVYARRTTPGHGLTYTVESTEDLVSGSWTNSGGFESPTTGTLDADFEAVTNRVNTTGKTNEFIRLRIDLV